MFLFVTASLALLISPGPAVLYIVARSIDQGRLSGLVSVASVEVGNFCHVLAATLGLSALLLSSPVVFSMVKYLGAAYLIYLGIEKWASKRKQGANILPVIQSRREIFFQGVVVAVLNPKTALFFLAFLPQFVDVSKGSPASQIFLLGLIFVSLAFFTDSLYALAAGSARHWLRSSRVFLMGERYFSGVVFIGLGLMTILPDILSEIVPTLTAGT
jgi:threonine/homoserine/homoserine lactone efflux protein